MKNVARAWAGFDLLVTGIMALPPTGRWLVDLIHRLAGEEVPLPDPTRLFFVCLAGALGVIWALVRLRAPTRDLMLVDVVGRTWVAALIFWFVAVQDLPRSTLLFVASELGGALHQGFALRLDRGGS